MNVIEFPEFIDLHSVRLQTNKTADPKIVKVSIIVKENNEVIGGYEVEREELARFAKGL